MFLDSKLLKISKQVFPALSHPCFVSASFCPTGSTTAYLREIKDGALIVPEGPGVGIVDVDEVLKGAEEVV